MATFLFAYRVPQDYALGRPDAASAWSDWFASMGGGLLDIGKPVAQAAALGDAPAGTRLGGYSLVAADDLDAALTLAKGCPVLAAGGTVEVGALAEIPGRPA
jgi:hypothetical protein